MKRPTDVFWIELGKIDQQLSDLSYYELLGVSADASIDEMRERYERQVRVLHPDRHVRESNPQRKEALTRVYARVGEAFRILSHARQRASYDLGLAKGTIRFQNNRTEHAPRDDADPKHPQAKSLYEQALEMLKNDDKRGARAKLGLAKQYQSDSKAIADALALCQERVHTIAPPEAPEPAAAPEPGPKPEPDSKLSTTTEQPTTAGNKSDMPPGRVHERAPMGQSIRISCKQWQQVQTFYMHNISQGGMLLRCKQQLPIGSILELTLVTPDGESIQIPAEVVRHVDPLGPGKQPGIGVRFIIIPDLVRDRFEALLKLAGLRATKDEAPTADPKPIKGPEQRARETAESCIESGDYQAACKLLQKVIKDFPDDKSLRATFHLSAGLMARERSQDAAAHNHFERALRYNPDSSLILRALREEVS